MPVRATRETSTRLLSRGVTRTFCAGIWWAALTMSTSLVAPGGAAGDAGMGTGETKVCGGEVAIPRLTWNATVGVPVACAAIADDGSEASWVAKATESLM